MCITIEPHKPYNRYKLYKPHKDRITADKGLGFTRVYKGEVWDSRA